MGIQTLTRRQRIVTGVILFYATVFLLLLCLKPGGAAAFEEYFTLFHLTPQLVAGICCITYAFRGQRRTPLHRLAWTLIGLAGLAYLSGNFIWLYYSTVNKGKVPFPSLADAAWLSAVPLLVTGMLMLYGLTRHVGRVRMLLDSTIATGSIGLICWRFLIEALLQRSGLTTFAKVVSVVPVIADVIALFCAIVLLNGLHTRHRQRAGAALMATGIICWSFGDILYAYANLYGTYHIGSWFDWGWPFAALLFTYAALFSWWTERQDNAETGTDTSVVRPPHVLQLVMPYIAAGVSLFVVIFYDVTREGFIHSSTLTMGIGLALVIMLRQVFTLWENRHLTHQLSDQLTHNQELTEELSALNEELEHHVAERTRQLDSLLELTKAVNSTLNMDDVLAGAIEHTRHALDTEAALLWLCSSDEERHTPLCHQTGLDNHPQILAHLLDQEVQNKRELLPLRETSGDTSREGVCMRVPLRWQHRLLGMIGVVRWNTQVEPTEWELLQSIGVEVGAALSNARQYHAALEAADKDPLTELLNHRAIHQFLDGALEKARQKEQQVSVVMLDINNFKLFNDTYGHPVGDEVLKTAARALHMLVPAGGHVGRYGGDEFLIVLPESDVSQAMRLVTALQQNTTQLGFRDGNDDRVIPVAFSCGIAAYPSDSERRHELIATADSNLYAAKRSGDMVRVTGTMQQVTRQLRAESSFEVLDALVTAVDNKDSYTRRHSEDVTQYALWTAEELNVSEETLRLIRIGGLLHDVGKIGVPAEILCKPGRLTDEEYEILQRHTRLGSLIVGAIPGMEGIVDAVRSHHERWDGRGYPDATLGEDTPFLGRLLAVADAFSAMTTDRPYRKGMAWEVAVEEVRKHTGTQFDPRMAQAFLRALGKRMQTPQAAPEVPAQEIEPLRKAA
jgi:diguanylate cyclase (GGDEF)-like protein